MHKIHTSVFRDNNPIIKALNEVSVNIKPETIKNQKKHPNELQVEQPVSKRLKFQKG